MKKQRIFFVVEKIPDPSDYWDDYECPCCEDRMVMKDFEAEQASWAAHYEKFHGMTPDQFYRIEDGIDS